MESALAPMRSVYYQNNAEPPLTTKTVSFAGCIDYIWFSFCLILQAQSLLLAALLGKMRTSASHSISLSPKHSATSTLCAHVCRKDQSTSLTFCQCQSCCFVCPSGAMKVVHVAQVGVWLGTDCNTFPAVRTHAWPGRLCHGGRASYA